MRASEEEKRGMRMAVNEGGKAKMRLPAATWARVSVAVVAVPVVAMAVAVVAV